MGIVDCFDKKVIGLLRNNWVMQRVLKVHPQLKKLNKSTETIMRMLTFYINDIVYMTSASARIGMEGTVKDDTPTKRERGSGIVGATDDGYLKEYGYYPCGIKAKMAPDGVKFGGMKVSSYPEAVE